MVDTREVLGITSPPSADALQLPVCRTWHQAPAQDPWREQRWASSRLPGFLPGEGGLGTPKEPILRTQALRGSSGAPAPAPAPGGVKHRPPEPPNVIKAWAAPLPPAATKVPRAHLGSRTRCLLCCSPSSVQAPTRCCFFCPVPGEPPARGLRPGSFLHTLLKSHRPAVASSFSVENAGHMVKVRLDVGRRRRAPARERALWFGALGSRVRACWAAASAEIPMWWLKGKKAPA